MHAYSYDKGAIHRGRGAHPGHAFTGVTQFRPPYGPHPSRVTRARSVTTRRYSPCPARPACRKAHSSAAPASTPAPDLSPHPGSAQNTSHTGATSSARRIVCHTKSYPYRSACPSTVWADLIDSAGEELFFAGYTNYFLWTQVPAFADTLRRKAAEGCRVRFLLGDPEGQVTRQREVVEDVALSVSTRIRITLENLDRLGKLDELETRFSAPEDATNHVSLSVFRFDHEALVTPHLARLVGHDSPLLHLRRQGDKGMFARFSEHAEELWQAARPLPTR